jgi:hypothetical protein
MASQVPTVDPFLFTKTLEFTGVFRDGQLATKPLSVEIRYSLLNAHPPIGIIRGTAADWPGLESFFRDRRPSPCELDSVSAATGREKICSRQVLLREISCRHPDDESETIQQILGHFEPWDVTIEQDYGQRGKGNRRMTFFLTGPTLIWMSHAIRRFSYTGTTKTTFPRARLWDSRVKDVRVTVQPHFFYPGRFETERLFEPREGRRNQHDSLRLSVEAEAFALEVTDRRLNRTDEAFEATALAIAEVLFLLASFLSKANVTWYARTLWSDGRLSEHYRDAREVPTCRLWWQDVVLYPENVRRFISKAFIAYHERANDGVNLRLPILLYVAAQSAPTIEEGFILLFRCLEKVVDMLDQMHPRELLSKSELRNIAKLLRAGLREMGKDDETVTAIDEKRKELARPTFRSRLSRHLRRLRLDLADIGGADSLGETIRMRDSLIHAADEPAIGQIVQEQKRLETVVERVLLTLLNWRGPTNTPTLRNRSMPAGE